MSFRPALLQTLAAVAWGTTIIGAFTGYDDRPGFSDLDGRMWIINAAIACIITLVGLLSSQVARRVDTAYAAMARSFITRPAEPRNTGPLPLIDARTPGPVPGLRALNGGGGRHTRHATHVNPR